nr:hypothetical protein [Tanacetum cinerariifolium]
RHEAPPSPDYIPGHKAPPSPDYIPGPEAPPSPDYIPGLEAHLHQTTYQGRKSEPEMKPEENDGDDEKSEGDFIDYPTSRGDNDANDDGDDLSEDEADEEDEEESSDSEEEEEEHLAPTIPAPALYTSVFASEETEPFEEEVERLLDIPTPQLSPFSPTSYPLPPFLMPLPIFTRLPTSSFPLPSSILSTSGSESIPEVDIPLRKRARLTTPTSRYEIARVLLLLLLLGRLGLL